MPAVNNNNHNFVHEHGTSNYDCQNQIKYFFLWFKNFMNCSVLIKTENQLLFRLKHSYCFGRTSIN
jgi:hypothetical protein